MEQAGQLLLSCGDCLSTMMAKKMSGRGKRGRCKRNIFCGVSSFWSCTPQKTWVQQEWAAPQTRSANGSGMLSKISPLSNHLLWVFECKKYYDVSCIFLTSSISFWFFRSNLRIGIEETSKMIVSSQSTRPIVESTSRIHSKRGGPSVGARTNLERRQAYGMKWPWVFGAGTFVGVMAHSHVGCSMTGKFLIN